MAEEQQQRQEEFAKWEGKVSTTLPAVAADQVWPLLADFCSFQRWHPSVEACRLDGGVAGEPGCVRFCTGKSVQSVDGEGVAWVRERLTAIDHAGRRLSYEMTENTIGWGSYEATMEVIGGDGEEGGCRIEWSFRMEPVAGGTEEGVVAYLGSTLEGMAKTIQDFLLGCRAHD